MNAVAAFDGGTFIADTSAWHRASHPRVSHEWERALLGGQIATSPIVMLELLYSATGGDAFDELERSLRFLREVPVTRSVTDAAIGALRELAHAQPLFHRVAISDALVAAGAEDAGVGVLHYDAHYDRLAQVLTFESRWIAPAGTLS